MGRTETPPTLAHEFGQVARRRSSSCAESGVVLPTQRRSLIEGASPPVHRVLWLRDEADKEMEVLNEGPRNNDPRSNNRVARRLPAIGRAIDGEKGFRHGARWRE